MNTIKLLAYNQALMFTETLTKYHNIKITNLSCVNWSLNEHYIIYKIINNVNGKHYIGQHTTNDPCDEYMGSGNLINKAKQKYDLSSFTKIILFDYDNFDDMNNKEKELVTLSSCYPYDPMSYNLMEGGHNGKLTEETKKKLSESKKGEKNPYHKSHGRKNPIAGKTVLERFHNNVEKYDAWKRANSEGHKGINAGEQNYWHKSHGRIMPMNRKDVQEKARLKRIGQKRTNEQKKHMSENRKGKCCGKEHVFYKKSFKDWLKEETCAKIGKTKNDVICPLDFMNDYEITEWKNKLSKAFTGRIRIYDPITGKRHLIDASDLQKYLDVGWIVGYNCSAIGGKIGIYNEQTHKTKYIHADELQKYLDNGWKRGTYINPTKIHKIKVYNDIIKKAILIDPKDYVAYYYDGWSLDLPNHASKGKVIVRNENTLETKIIFKEELQLYLNKGWKKGRFPNKRKRVIGKTKNKSKFLKLRMS